MVERRPNPPGWRQPRAPYNPYDPSDQRPAQGYPSEFKTPGRPRNWSLIPKEPTNYREVKESMRRLNYTPRPASEKYPGQYKVLRRKPGGSFNRGVYLMAKISTVGVLIGTIFFYRWNDGYDNVFSEPYRWQLRMRQRLFGNLSEQQVEDLKGKQRGMQKKSIDHANSTKPRDLPEADIALERPERSHVIEAERIRQEREEAILRAVEIAEHKIRTQSKSSKWWPW